MKFSSITFKTLLVASIVLAAGCKKPSVKPLGDAGQTIVKLGQSDFSLFALNYVNTMQSFSIDVRRDIPSEAELNKPMTVVVMLDPTVINSYNSANGTSYVALPSASFTVDASTPRSGNNITVTFAPGEFAKNIKINVPDASTFDLTMQYALGFKVASVDGNGKISAEMKTLVAEVGVKNRLDGKYRIKGVLSGHPTLSGPYTDAAYPCGTFSLVTSGPNSVDLYDAHPYGAGAGGTSLGLFGVYPGFAVDPVTNKVTAFDAGGTLASVQNFSDYNSRYDPATKTIYVKFGWNGSRVVTDTLVYCGAR